MPKGMSSHTRARRVAAVALTAAMVGVGLVPAASAAGGSEVEFTDSDLAACVRQELGISAGAPITLSALASVTFLDCEDSSPIGSLVGLEHATNLQYLDLYGVLAAASGVVLRLIVEGFSTTSLPSRTCNSGGVNRSAATVSAGVSGRQPCVTASNSRDV